VVYSTLRKKMSGKKLAIFIQAISSVAPPSAWDSACLLTLCALQTFLYYLCISRNVANAIAALPLLWWCEKHGASTGHRYCRKKDLNAPIQLPQLTSSASALLVVTFSEAQALRFPGHQISWVNEWVSEWLSTWFLPCDCM